MPSIRLRRDTAATWTSTNPVLAAGEPGVETNTGRMKVGNGVLGWTALPYIDSATGTWQDWTPGLFGTNTEMTYGGGSVREGRYVLHGKTCHYTGSLYLMSGSSLASGIARLSLPVAHRALNSAYENAHVGTMNVAGPSYNGVGQLAMSPLATTTKAAIIGVVLQGDNIHSPAIGAGWLNAGQLVISYSGTYETA